MSVLAVNKKAGFDYSILETFEAGLVLLGYEVKSIKAGHISLKEAYIDFRTDKEGQPELYLLKAHVPLYKPAGKVDDYNPTRSRKLLLRGGEIAHLIGKKHQAGLTLIPLRIYTKNSFIKLEFGLAQGRKKYDKREVIKKREVERSIRTLTKRRQK
jgi:SsrA-binding protein